MQREPAGYFSAEVSEVPAGSRYAFRLDAGPPLPDPASRAQPDGVDGWSAVVDERAFTWTDGAWRGVDLGQLVFYELHVGTFSRAGTFAGVERRLPYLRDLGITAVELMPVAEFPGRRNWGYDGVYPFAVHHAYGGLAGLQHLSDACHAAGIALFVDVVYNHLGPEGNHLARFGPYFTDRYRTPWGAALNFDGAGSDEVRRFFVESATWLADAAHLDGFRVDAVHAVVDPTAQPFLAELTRSVHDRADARHVRRWMIAESALNDPRVVRPDTEGGLGFDAAWNDDFHHALHVALTGERSGYYADFDGVADVRRVLVDGFALAGRFSPFRGRRHGRPAIGVPADRFVVFAQNHDHIGNRAFGDRLGRLVPFEAQKLAAGATLLGPFLPLLFMGEEYGETAPFLYFTDHAGRRLAAQVRSGRRAEVAGTAGAREPPDPQAPATFERSRLDWRRRARGRHRQLGELHAVLLALRRAFIVPQRLSAREVGTDPADPTAVWIDRPRTAGRPASLLLLRFGNGSGPVRPPRLTGPLELRVASSARRWGGPGGRLPTSLEAGRPRPVPLAPWSFAFYAERGRR
jgi:maltooligosyltrehalose trehalohydrolase